MEDAAADAAVAVAFADDASAAYAVVAAAVTEPIYKKFTFYN